MKTSHKFSLNPWNKQRGRALLCLLFFQILGKPVYGKEQQAPGVIESLEKIISIDRQKFAKKVELISSNIIGVEKLNQAKNLHIDPDFVTSSLIRTDSRYLYLLNDSPCSYYNVLLANLIKTPEGKIDNVLVKFTDEKGIEQFSMLSEKDFISQLIKKKCPETLNNQKNFTVKNFPTIVEGLKISSVRDHLQCKNMLDGFINNAFAPYICRLYEIIENKEDKQISMASQYLDTISASDSVSLNHLCRYMDRPEVLCEKFLSKNFWETALSNKEQRSYAEFYCQEKLKNNNPSDAQLRMCLSEISSQPKHCHYARQRRPALFPKPNCEQLSSAINHSRIYAQYEDCPGANGNDSVTNIARLIAHFQQKSPPPSQGICSIGPTSLFADFSLRSDNEKGWGGQICYHNKMLDREFCFPSLMGNVEGSDYSEEKTVVNILQKIRGAEQNEKCQVVSLKKYNPVLLQYKAGCVLVYDESCTATNCPKKVYYNERLIEGITYKNDFNFDYFPNSVLTEKYAQTSVLKRELKLKQRSIANLSILKNLFANNSKAIAHGVGCAEDLLPQHFKKKTFNQCTPLPFIVDGLVQDENLDDALVVRTSLDDLHAPRIMEWSTVYNAAKTYQQLNPMQKWTFQGLYE